MENKYAPAALVKDMPLKNYYRQITVSEKFRELPSTMRESIIFVTVRERCHR